MGVRPQLCADGGAIYEIMSVLVSVSFLHLVSPEEEKMRRKIKEATKMTRMGAREGDHEDRRVS